MATGLLLDDRFCEHRPSPSHPECPDRVAKIIEKLRADGLDTECASISFSEAPRDLLLLNHTAEYIQRVQNAVSSNSATLDSPDVEISEQSFSVASAAVHAACNAIDMIVAGTIRNAFLASRPPGHHAEFDRAMGFCIFNNAAIAARYAQQKHSLDKVFIFDWDVHHGNGTQHSFESDPTVFYCSTHTNPASYYPGTGFASETGKADGECYTLNIPLEPGTEPGDYIQIFEKQVLPAFEQFAPDLLIVSAGFDAHEADPLGNQKLQTETFKLLSDELLSAAASVCSARVLSVLEGGYNLDALARSVSVHLESLVEHS
jgi:acetoin utilization deacetylase AcuC-like enzyme